MHLPEDADIGISVNNAVDIAKDSAEIILLEKDLRCCMMVSMREGRPSET